MDPTRWLENVRCWLENVRPWPLQVGLMLASMMLMFMLGASFAGYVVLEPFVDALAAKQQPVIIQVCGCDGGTE